MRNKFPFAKAGNKSTMPNNVIFVLFRHGATAHGNNLVCKETKGGSRIIKTKDIITLVMEAALTMGTTMGTTIWEIIWEIIWGTIWGTTSTLIWVFTSPLYHSMLIILIVVLSLF